MNLTKSASHVFSVQLRDVDPLLDKDPFWEEFEIDTPILEQMLEPWRTRGPGRRQVVQSKHKAYSEYPPAASSKPAPTGDPPPSSGLLSRPIVLTDHDIVDCRLVGTVDHVEYGHLVDPEAGAKGPAARLLFTFRFIPGDGLRFKSAKITLEFLPQAADPLVIPPLNAPLQKLPPVIARVEPKHTFSQHSRMPVTTSYHGNFTLGYSGISAGGGLDKKATVIYKDKLQIFGSGVGTSKAEFELLENRETKSGLVDEFFSSVVLQHGGPFMVGVSIRVKVTGGNIFRRLMAQFYPIPGIGPLQFDGKTNTGILPFQFTRHPPSHSRN
ncbi:hypothetical protein SISSUDRAFT_1045199 [Sistotremastrum suecicum HHB10207 ss-3]|uniref:Uncharacterized protein n=1 Tax=Sistotremastrum suecicum HHB10207 ss-3 TaxID=1314776 RepID=A0A166EKF3_9AGAM|nr:hypothetical protein SISSUDRAFT_1045199 [Sistotremastrum suecicum HHB10207 ss-3]